MHTPTKKSEETDFHKHKNSAHIFEKGKKVAGRAEYDLLAAAAAFCSAVCLDRLRYFKRHSFGKQSESHPADPVFLSVSRLFHNQAYIIRGGWNPEH